MKRHELNLDELEENQADSGAVRSNAAGSVKDQVEDEKCVLGQYRTTTVQKNIFAAHLAASNRNNIPIEWVIDIADESNEWFFGTAYHYNDSNQMLHVMVPDKQNPTFDGKIPLDHRTVRLIECTDGKSDALFNKIVRDSVMKIKWDVDYYEEPEVEGGEGQWITSAARYYIRITNQLLVEDKDFGQESRGFVIMVADVNLRLKHCHKGKGQEDFNRLINEKIVQATEEAWLEVKQTASVATPKKSAGPNEFSEKNDRTAETGSVAHSKSSKNIPDTPGGSSGGIPSAVKLCDLSKDLHDCIADLLDGRERTKNENVNLSNMFHNFAINGDLDDGLNLLEHFEKVQNHSSQHHRAETEDDKLDGAYDDAKYLSQKLEKGLVKVVKGNADWSLGLEEEVEALRRSLKKARKELDEKEREIERLRNR